MGAMMKTIKEIYKYTKTNEIPLLSNYSGEWWAEYVNNYSIFDDMFAKMFKSFVYFDQDEEQTVDEVQEEFTNTVYNWLMFNDKRYSELYRIHVIEDNEAYELTNNYDIHENYSGSSSGATSSITGQRTDISYDNIGEQNASNLNKVTGYNSSSENTNDSSNTTTGTREDVHQFTKGQEQDTSRSQGNDGHTLRRYGNLGVMTVDDILTKHKNFWLVFNFYELVFNDICKNFLLIGR